MLDVGQCLVGGVKIAQFEIKNEGGPARFALLKTDHWPASNFKVKLFNKIINISQKQHKAKAYI